MIVFRIVLMIVVTLGTIIFLANSIPALFDAKRKEPDVYWNSNLLIFSGLMTFLALILFLLFAISSIEGDLQVKEKPEYEIIQGPVYRKLP